MLAEAGGFRAGDHILEIGCGWGGFAEYAARELGCRVTCLTISKEQHAFAVDRMARLGLSDRVDIRLQDYRDERGTYDGIASIEMFEAVGEQYWPDYFDQLRDRLKQGGRRAADHHDPPALLGELPDGDRFHPPLHHLPGGMLPTPAHLDKLAQERGLANTSSASRAGLCAHAGGLARPVPRRLA